MLKARLVVIACVASWVGLAVPTLSEAGSSTTGRCGFVRASVPYSHHGRRNRWGVYVKGTTTCSSARSLLYAVMHLGATAHNGSDNADSYFSDGRWTCDFGQMGAQSCWRPRHPPYSAAALALDCATAPGGCPGRVPNEDLP